MSNSKYKLNKYLDKTKLLIKKDRELINNNKLINYLEHLSFYIQKGGYDNNLFVNIEKIISKIREISKKNDCNNKEIQNDLQENYENLKKKEEEIIKLKESVIKLSSEESREDDNTINFINEYPELGEDIKYYEMGCYKLTNDDKLCIENRVNNINDFFNNFNKLKLDNIDESDEIKKTEINKKINEFYINLEELLKCFENIKNDYIERQNKLEKLDNFIVDETLKYKSQMGGNDIDDIIAKINTLLNEIKEKIIECKNKIPKINELKQNLIENKNKIYESKNYIGSVLINGCKTKIGYIESIINDLNNMYDKLPLKNKFIDFENYDELNKRINKLNNEWNKLKDEHKIDKLIN